MSRQVELALNNIIPRNSGALPRELIELADSLLAQSRNKCSNLRQEEEVARTYLCANLACERLKTSLNLPPIEPRPPIPPRAYKSLYAYFDKTLTTSAARQRAQKAAAQPQTPAKPLPQRQTPSKAKNLESFAPSSNRTPKRPLKFLANTEKDERIPKWVAPVTRLVCKELETPKAVPHVLAGVESILCLPLPLLAGKDGVSNRVEENVAALIAAIWFFVVVKMRGRGGQAKETMARKMLVRDVLAKSKDDPKILEKVGGEIRSWKGWELVEEKDVNSWRKEIVARGWREMDWFDNIDEGCGVEGNAGDEVDSDEVHDVQAKAPGVDEPARNRTRSLTMIKDDYLSEAKQKEYEIWKRAILAKIHDLERRRAAGGTSDVDICITTGSAEHD